MHCLRMRLAPLIIAICFSFVPKAKGFRPPKVSQELGCSPTLSLVFGTSQKPFFFDPLSLANDVNFPRLREAELKHGRVCMLAVAVTVFVPFLKGPILPKTYPTGILHCLSSFTWTDYGRILATCAILETFVFVPRDPKAMPGDYGTGYFGIRDKGWNESSLVSELENGRLAMIAFVSQLVAEIITAGKSWDEQWLGFFKAWVREALQL